MIGNLIKQQFLDNRDWPLGSALSLALVGAVLGIMGLASVAARPRHGAWVRGHRAASKRVRAAELEAAPSMMNREAS
ncbi:hypothetical protein [Ralstonia pickettii]|uniref:hypothetical protein n=1 Tax=Ralstonia pickettii TaxID=329 RepID=UPI00030DCA31|nr:hypothetical protein [Ralstonia pickettii]